MGDESAKRAAQEFLAAKIIEEGQTREAQLNQDYALEARCFDGYLAVP